MAIGTSGIIAADRADRRQIHRCPECEAALTLKRGRLICAHFAHARSAVCSWAHGETLVHMRAKAAIARGFTQRGLSAQVEAEVLSGEGDRRADVLVTHPRTGARIAIEIQHSALSLDAIERRTRAYLAAGVGVIWIPTLDFNRLAPRPLAHPRLLAVDRYAAPTWQRFAAAYHGQLWFWGSDALWRGWFDDAWVARPDQRDPNSSGWMRSRQWSGLTLEGPFEPHEVRICMRANRVEPHEDFSLPAGFAAGLIIPGDIAIEARPTHVKWTNYVAKPRLRLATHDDTPRSRPSPPGDWVARHAHNPALRCNEIGLD